MKCNYCGNEVPDGSLTCPSCGGAIQQPQAASQQQAPQGAPPVQQTVVVVQQGPAPVPKSRTVYVILAFFFGGLGIHNFYAGRTGCGIAQLLISLLSCGFLSGIVWIWVLIEMFVVTRDGKGVPMRGGALLLAVILVIVWLILAILALGLLPALNSAREEARISVCASNLKQIGLGLMQYSFDFESRFPVQDNARGMEALRSTGVLTDHAVYVCPSTETTAGSENEPLTDANCDYIYLGGLFNTDWTIDCPIVIERPGNHVGNSVNVLYAAGNVNTITLPDSVQTVTELLEYLADEATDPKVEKFLKTKQQTVF